ncbi:MAG: hypothetical protein ACREST_08725, partial [Steroidobacteraceae bacterium]
MRFPIAILAAMLVVTACGDDTERAKTSAKRDKAVAAAERPPGAPAVVTRRLDFASCLAESLTDDAAQSSR